MRKYLFRLNSVAVFLFLALLFTCNGHAFAQHTVTVNWTAPAKDTNGNPLPATGPGSITGYVVLRATAQAGPYVSIATPGAVTSFTDSPLPAPCLTSGCSLWYEVEAVNSVGTSAPGAQANAIVPAPAPTAPGAPLATTVTVN